VLDGYWDEVLDMPSGSWWPFLCAGSLLLLFFMLLAGHLTAVCVCVALVLLTLVGWHQTEPQEA
jgi:hypothetical protein